MTTSSQLNPRLHTREPLERCGFPKCQAACCFLGTWVDTIHIEDILSHKDLIIPHMPPAYQHPELWFDERLEPDDKALSGMAGHTTVMPDPGHYRESACIFMREDYKCALQVAAEAAEMPSWRFKPFYCILHPLTLDEHGRITLGDTQELAGEPASCLRYAEAVRELEELFQQELSYLLKG